MQIKHAKCIKPLLQCSFPQVLHSRMGLYYLYIYYMYVGDKNEPQVKMISNQLVIVFPFLKNMAISREQRNIQIKLVHCTCGFCLCFHGHVFFCRSILTFTKIQTEPFHVTHTLHCLAAKLLGDCGGGGLFSCYLCEDFIEFGSAVEGDIYRQVTNHFINFPLAKESVNF